MDHFREDIVGRRNTGLWGVFYFAGWALVIVFAVYALLMLQMLMLQFSVGTLALFVLSAAAAVFFYFAKDEMKVEYEYTFTNGTLDFAKVLRGARRKELGSMTVANVAACGHVAHPSFKRYLSMRDADRKNWFLNRDGNLFYFYYEKEGRKHIIVIEPSEELVQLIRLYVPAGVYQG